MCPYRGGALAMQDLVGGRLDHQCDQLVTAKPQIEGGAVKGLAILTRERSPVLLNLPTALEQGTDVQAYAWTALFLPKRTPEAIVETLNKAVVEALRTPAVRQRILELGSIVFGGAHDPAISRWIHQKRDREMGPTDQSERRDDGLRAFSLIFRNVRSANGGNETAMART